MYAVEVHDLKKVFNKVTRAVDGITFHIEEGELYGLLGPNGAGKTTTIRMLLTLIKPTSGSIRVFGMDPLKMRSDVRQICGNVPQEVSADGDLTGYENMLIFSKLYYVRDRKERKERIARALEYMGLSERADDLVKHYSGGMIRRLEIAQALVNRPRVLFLDEPTIGLDPAFKREVWKHLRDLNHDFGMTVLMTTHDMSEADELCERIAILNAGKIVAEGTPSELKEALGGDIITVRMVPPGSAIAVTGVSAMKVAIPSSIGTIMSETNEETVIMPLISGEQAVPKILAEYEKAGIAIFSISLRKPSLDDVFLKFAKMRIGEAESMRSARLARRAFGRHAR